jgi:hypothetical protein
LCFPLNISKKIITSHSSGQRVLPLSFSLDGEKKMKFLSLDLAHRTYADIGAVLIESQENAEPAKYEIVPLEKYETGAPEPSRLVSRLLALSLEHGVKLILLDGPQGWKDPETDLLYCRRCERELNTPAKTGLPGIVKPASYTRFVEFSISVFDELHLRGWSRFDKTTWFADQPTTIETFPLSAWRSLNMKPLPSKARAKHNDIVHYYERLVGEGYLERGIQPNHDQLQALVAGLSGVGLSTSPLLTCKAYGVPAHTVEDIWREGYIVNPIKRADR